MVKKGFSLIEALVVMGIVSILFACAVKVITVKPKVEKQSLPHGYYECYRSAGMSKTFFERTVRDDMPKTKENSTGKMANICTFVPPVGASFYSINYYSSGSSEKFVYSAFEPNINGEQIYIDMEDDGTLVYSNTSSIDASSYKLPAELRKKDPADITAMETYIRTMFPDAMLIDTSNGNFRQVNDIIISW